MKQLMLAGATSGVGKTTITLGILKALMDRGLRVQPYKVGPDYIDTGFHSRVCQRQSINLDQFLVPDPKVLQALYLRSLSDTTNMALIEGVMGLYDGLGVDHLYCSSAGVAVALECPVVLIIDGKSSSTSAAAIVKGFMAMESRINIVGVLVNRVASQSHFELIQKAIETYNDVPVLGYLPKNSEFELPSRHLGLIPDLEIDHVMDKIELVAQAIAKYVDLDRLLKLANRPQHFEQRDTVVKRQLEAFEQPLEQEVTIAYAYDKAFSFYYEDNLALLRKKGVKLIAFSPLNDQTLPVADSYYFGGGFPEIFAKELAHNEVMLQAIRAAHQKGVPIFAECGGLMYLGETLEVDGKPYEMVGIIEGNSYMTSRLKRFGYCTLVAKEDFLLALRGEEIRGHEFHHSDFTSPLAMVGNVYKKRDGQIIKEWEAGFAVGNIFASYLHIHFYQTPQIVERWLEQVIQQKNKFTGGTHG